MIFEKDKREEKTGEKAGYIFSYLLFTTFLFVILSLIKKIPENWTYLHIAAITALISIIGISLKRWLK